MNPRICSRPDCGEALTSMDPRASYCSRRCKDADWRRKNRNAVRSARPDTAPRREEAQRRLIERRRITEAGCWEWTGRLSWNGYGVISIWSGNRLVHRISWESFRGPVPDGLQLDHLCRNRACFNPDHLEPVTQRENLLRGETLSGANARKTHCANGHEFVPENIYWHGTKRNCRKCTRDRQTVRRAAGASS